MVIAALIPILLRDDAGRACRPWKQLLGQVLARSKSAEVAALVRTTAAVTDLRTFPPGDNVLPDTAIASFNFRLLPGTAARAPCVARSPARACDAMQMWGLQHIVLDWGGWSKP